MNTGVGERATAVVPGFLSLVFMGSGFALAARPGMMLHGDIT